MTRFHVCIAVDDAWLRGPSGGDVSEQTKRRHRQGDLMLCDDCDEYRFPRKPTSSSATTTKSVAGAVGDPMASTKLVKCEVLYFIIIIIIYSPRTKYNMKYMPFDSVVTICSDFYRAALYEGRSFP